MVPVRNPRIAARLWWATLPYAGWVGYDDEPGAIPPPWYAHPLAWINRIAAKLPGSEPFLPMDLPTCTCDYCRGVPSARFEP